MYDFSELKKKKEEIKEWLKKEYAGIRTGRAAPAILDKVTVEAYGMKMPLNQMATITVQDSRTLRLTPWDQSQTKAVEKALTEADLGLSVTADSSGLRVIFPELTSERREQLKKVLRQRQEQARVSLRTEREKTWDDIQQQEKTSEISEDDKFRLKEEMQKLIDQTNREIDELTNQKEEEIMTQ